MARGFLAFLLAALLAACGTTPKSPTPPPQKKPSYYSDDGPPDKVPDDIASIPDAVPRAEPYHRYANRPYTVFGRSYAPIVNDDPFKERGLASWYGKKFHGQKTSIGETYDMFAMTAAHKTLPLPSYARVTNTKTGQSVIVRVNDRGPFHEGRVIDLSYAAAAKLGIAGPGSGPVEVERVFAGQAIDVRIASAAPATTPLIAAAPVVPAAPAPVSVPMAAQKAPTVETAVVAPDTGGLYLQLGAFASVENAESFRAKMARDLTWLLEPIQILPRDSFYRVRLGPYKTREEAQAIADKIRASLDFAPVISPLR